VLKSNLNLSILKVILKFSQSGRVKSHCLKLLSSMIKKEIRLCFKTQKKAPIMISPGEMLCQKSLKTPIQVRLPGMTLTLVSRPKDSRRVRWLAGKVSAATGPSNMTKLQTLMSECPSVSSREVPTQPLTEKPVSLAA
jgi:hypothetical protein